MIEVGKKYIWYPVDHTTGCTDRAHVWNGHAITVMATESLGRYRVSVDDFPPCNNPAYHNRFVADPGELAEICEG